MAHGEPAVGYDAPTQIACAIWTEDTDFFGTGIAVWTTNHIEIFLEARAKALRSTKV